MLAIDIPSPVRRRAGSSLARGVLDCLDYGCLDLRGVFAVPLVIGAALQQDLIHSGRTNFGRRVGVRDGPPELLALDAFLLQGGRHFVVEFGREEAEVARYEEELRAAIVQRDHAMIDAVVYAGGLARTVAQQPLRRLGSDVDLGRRGAEGCRGKR